MSTENKVQSQSDTISYVFDFSDVDFSTGKGGRLGFDSFEEMDAYLKAYGEAEEKYKAGLKGNSVSTIIKFEMKQSP